MTTETNTTENQAAVSDANKAIVVDGIKAGHSKSLILTALLRADMTLDLVQAGALYTKVGTTEKLLLTSEAKDKLVVTIAKKFTHQVDKKKTLKRKEATAALAQEGVMSEGAAMGRLKTHCESSGILFPVATRAKRDMDAVKAAYKKWFEDKVERPQIEAGLVQHFEYTEASAKTAYATIGKELGLIAAGNAQGRVKLAAWFADPAKVVGTKKEIMERLTKDTGIKLSTAESRYEAYMFAVEYHKVAAAPGAVVETAPEEAAA